jgi:hypothetical protein
MTSDERCVTLTCSLRVRLSLSTRPQEAVLETRGNITTGGDVASAQTDNGRELTQCFILVCSLVMTRLVRDASLHPDD